MSRQLLTLLSSGCIATSGLALIVGWFAIRSKNVDLHRRSMLTASSLAAVFLVVYVTRWALYGAKAFEGTGGWKTLYLSILAPHILLAMVVPPMAIRLIQLALFRKDYDRHRRLARITLPIWLFVSASGWAVYYLLYVKEFS